MTNLNIIVEYVLYYANEAVGFWKLVETNGTGRCLGTQLGFEIGPNHRTVVINRIRGMKQFSSARVVSVRFLFAVELSIGETRALSANFGPFRSRLPQADFSSCPQSDSRSGTKPFVKEYYYYSLLYFYYFSSSSE